MRFPQVILICAALSSGRAAGQKPTQNRVLELAQLNSASIGKLDPARTLFILNNAPLEAHGPHIPISADTYQGEYCTRQMAAKLADSLPDWSIVVLPTLWYGIDGANLISERRDVQGTVSLRASTLRALAVDLGSQLAEQGFRWFFLVHIHGAALEHVALSDAADFVRETRGMGMYNVGSIGIFSSDPAVDSLVAKRYSQRDRDRIGFDVHAGASETGNMLAARPDLVSPDFRALPDVTVHDWEDLEKAGKRPEWRGYWSAPALADSAIGRRTLDAWAARWVALTLRAVRGEDISKLPHYPVGEPTNANTRQAARSAARQRTFEVEFRRWLAARKSSIDR